MASRPNRVLIENAKALFGVDPWLARGILAEETAELSEADAQAKIAHYLSSEITITPAPQSGLPALVFVGESQPPAQLAPALWIRTEDDPDNPGSQRPTSPDQWKVFVP